MTMRRLASIGKTETAGAIERPGMHSMTRRTVAGIVALMAAALLSACQSDLEGVAGTRGPNDKVKAPPSTAVEEVFGDKGTEITLLMAKGASGVYEGEARDVRDGAALAVGELGAGQVLVKVVDISGGSAAMREQVAAAKTRGSALLVSYASADATAAIAAVPADQRPPLIDARGRPPAGSANSYAFVSDEVDSATEGLKIAVAGGHKKVAVFIQADYPAGYDARIGEVLKKSGGTLSGVTRYRVSDDGAKEAVSKSKPLLASADTALILGNTTAAVMVAAQIRATAAQPAMALVGTSGWPRQTYANPAAAGVLITQIDPQNFTLIADRFNRRFGHPPTPAAAYGYDAVALAAGVIRAKGPTGLTPQIVTNTAGFSGLTGLFRFTSGGSVERKLTPFSVGNGKLNPLGTAAKGF